MTINNRQHCATRSWLPHFLLVACLLNCPILIADAQTDSISDSAVDCERIYQAPGHGISFYEENPTYIDPRLETGLLPSATPASHGLDAKMLEKGVSILREEKRTLSLIVVKDGDVVVEEYFHGSAANQSNNIHSASKSIMSTLVGIAIDQGFIKSVDQRLSDFLPEYFSDSDSALKRSLTIRHLLTMSAGFEWRHDPVSGTEIEIQKKPDWVGAVLSLPIVDPPGSKFFYNTGLTHLMSAVIGQATGMSTCQFAHRYLLEPIGITVEHWGRDPQGVYSGGYNFYITPREMATFGELILNGGRYKDRQIVPRDWIKKSFEPAFERSNGEGSNPWFTDDKMGYGYNWWLLHIKEQDLIAAWGWGGQMIYIIPQLDTVVVITRDTSNAKEVAEHPFNDNFVRDYILPWGGEVGRTRNGRQR